MHNKPLKIELDLDNEFYLYIGEITFKNTSSNKMTS